VTLEDFLHHFNATVMFSKGVPPNPAVPVAVSPLETYPLAQRHGKYGARGAVAEVTVDYAMPDVREFVVCAYEIGGGEQKAVLWSEG
jgi:hypothetical protein